MKQYIFRSIIIFALFGYFSSNIVAQNSTGTTITYNFGTQYQLQSKILGETRQLLIYVPEKYKKSTEKFPVIYVLDGDKHYKHAIVSAEKLQKNGLIPASIIVAIPDNKGTHMRDYTQDSDKFSRFLREEVQSFVTKNFRTNEYKTLYGHSRPGAFVLETFVKEPNAFNSYIAASPVTSKKILTKFEKLFDKNTMLNQTIYFTVGGIDNEGSRSVNLMKSLSDLLTKRAPKSLQWKHTHLTQHYHHTTSNGTFYDGLAESFTDYQDPIISSYQQYLDGNGMDGIKAYFKKRALKYYTDEKITVNAIAGFGFTFMFDNKAQQAVDLLLDDIKNNHPTSIKLYGVLSAAYRTLGLKDKTLKVLEKMVSMAKQQNDPQLDRYESSLKRFKKSL